MSLHCVAWSLQSLYNTEGELCVAIRHTCCQLNQSVLKLIHITVCFPNGGPLVDYGRKLLCYEKEYSGFTPLSGEEHL